jgi:hypothetical protein
MPGVASGDDHRLSIGIALALTTVLGVGIFFGGLTWGLPSHAADRYLFGSRAVWTGETIAALKPAPERGAGGQASNIDMNPLAADEAPVRLNGTDADRAAILVRYRLFTHQPDEMTVMMALASMRPGAGDFDPKMYQYGGLFLYAVGAALKAADASGVIYVTPELAYYYDHPEAFARFYVVGRAYVALWGLAGIPVVFLLARRIARGAADRMAWVAGLLAALLYVTLPVVVNMAHECKPHLPGAVLMLAAMLGAVRWADRPGAGRAVVTGLLCGLAVGTVPTAWPVLVLPILVAIGRRGAWRQALGAIFVAVAAYGVTNPYVVIHLVTDASVLRSNVANTASMYGVGGVGAALVNAVTLLVEAAAPATTVVGLLAAVGLLIALRPGPGADGGWRGVWCEPVVLLMVPALLSFGAFALFAAGKPGEYGRFALPTAMALALLAAVAAGVVLRAKPAWGLVAYTGLALAAVPFSYGYVRGFLDDARGRGTRAYYAEAIRQVTRAGGPLAIGAFSEPAPYSVPPVDVFAHSLWLLPGDATPATTAFRPDVIITTYDDMVNAPVGAWMDEYRLFPSPARRRPARISWADKPFYLLVRPDVIGAKRNSE